MTTTKKTTTTEKPKLDLSPLEWRLVLVATLAIAYVAAWFGLETSTTPTPALPEQTPQASATWLDTLPPPKQPSFSVPAGWTVTTERPRPAPPVRATAPRRIRTRSS